MNLSDAELQRRLDAYHEHGTYRAAAEALGIDEANVRRSVRTAIRKNMGGDFLGSVADGYTIGKVTRLVGKDGVQMEWQHTHPDVEAVTTYIDELLAEMGASIHTIEEVAAPSETLKDKLTLYPIADVHFGQFSWGKETGGNYDTAIAKEQFLRNVGELFSLSPNSEEAIISILGDFFHADDNEAQTRRSHNHLDVDGRHDKVLHMGIELVIWAIDLALAKHQHITVHVTKGNHDEYASVALTAALFFRYQNNPRVLIDRSPMELWVYQWGKTMLGFTHGHKLKAQDMPGAMAAFEAEMWGDTKYRYAFSGHLHHNAKGPLSDEKHGAIWEIVPAFTEKDSYARGMGFSGLRSISSRTFDKDRGFRFGTYVQIV